MLTIIKINEGFCVVDLDEDTQLFDSIEEAQEVAGNVILEKHNRSEENKLKNYDKKFYSIQKKKGKNAAAMWASGKVAANSKKKGDEFGFQAYKGYGQKEKAVIKRDRG